MESKGANRMNVHFNSGSGEWKTPAELLENYIYRFGTVDLDPCCLDRHVRAKRHYTKNEDGLSQPWNGFVFMNPPYGRQIGDWCEKASNEVSDDTTVIGLLPGRVDTRWFHSYVFGKAKAIVFIKGRLIFEGAANSAPFPSCLALWTVKSNDIDRFEDLFAELGCVIRTNGWRL